MKFKTKSGSEYEIIADRIRRLNRDAGKRMDGEWVKLVRKPHIEVGYSAYLTLESLAAAGTDDYGTPASEASPFTTRITSTVTEVINDENDNQY